MTKEYRRGFRPGNDFGEVKEETPHFEDEINCKCSRCLNKQEEWEIEFEESFGLDHPIRTFRDHDDYLLVKSFISFLLQKEREKMAEKINCLRDKNRHGGKYPSGDFDNGYDLACGDILNLTRVLKEE